MSHLLYPRLTQCAGPTHTTNIVCSTMLGSLLKFLSETTLIVLRRSIAFQTTCLWLAWLWLTWTVRNVL